MRHVIVNRVVMAFVALCLACAGGFAWVAGLDRSRGAGQEPGAIPPRAASVVEGQRLFDERCLSCHEPQQLAAPLDPEKRRRFEEVLVDHGDATEAEDRLILDYLQTVTR